jgi:hypothetical protein
MKRETVPLSAPEVTATPCRQFRLKVPMGPYQSALHVVKDNQDRFLKIVFEDAAFIGQLGEKACSRLITVALYDQDLVKIEDLNALKGSKAVVVDISEKSAIIKPKLPNLGGHSMKLFLFVEISVMMKNGYVFPFARDSFEFQRFTHLNKMNPEEVKKTGKRTRDEKLKTAKTKKGSRSDDDEE